MIELYAQIYYKGFRMSVITSEEKLDLSSQYAVFKFENQGDKLYFLYIGSEKVKGDMGEFTSIKCVGFEPKANVEETLESASLRCFSANKMLENAITNGVFKPNKVYSVTLAEKDVKSTTSKFKYNKFDVSSLTVPDSLISKLKALIPNNGMEMEETSIDIATPAPKNI